MVCFKDKRRKIVKKARNLSMNIKEYFAEDRREALKLKPRLPRRVRVPRIARL